MGNKIHDKQMLAELSRSSSLQSIQKPATQASRANTGTPADNINITQDRVADAITNLRSDRGIKHNPDELEPEKLITGLKDQIKLESHQAHAAQAAGLDPERARKLLADD